MAYKANILLGQITRTHGFEGAVTVKLEKTFVKKIPELESVFLIIEGKPVPFLIVSVEHPGIDTLWLKFDGYESVQKVQEFTGLKVFLTSESQKKNHEEDLNVLIGYNVFSADNRKIGCITGLIENPGQVLLNLATEDGRKLLVPFHENLIIRSDRKQKNLKMDLPEGLTELNL